MAPVTFRSGPTVLRADACEDLAAAAARGTIGLSALARDPYPGDPLGDELPEIRTVGTWDTTRDQDWGLPWHRNEGIELTLLSRGRLAFATDAGSHLLRPGDLTITRPWQRHRVGDPHVRPAACTGSSSTSGFASPTRSGSGRPGCWPTRRSCAA
jgi:AraC family L-rhamnose operon regulatory protein RhaS